VSPRGASSADGGVIAALEVSGVTKRFSGPVPVLDRFDLTLGPGEVHALAGGNGSGKSTFIKVLSGYHVPDAGTVTLQGRPLSFGSPAASYALGCRFVHQDLGLVNSCSVLDNLSFTSGYPCSWGTIRGRQARDGVAADLARVGLDLDPRRLVGSLSRAEQTGVAVARALRPDSDVPVRLLVLDEPTATLPGDEVAHLLQTIRTVAATGVAVLYVTHRLDEIFLIADMVTVLRDGQKVGTCAVTELDRAGLVHQMVGHELDDVAAAAATVHAHADDAVLQVRNLQAPAIDDVSFSVRGGDIVGFAGVTGSGREQLLPALFGAIPRNAGSVVVAGQDLPVFAPDAAVRSGVGYVPPDRKTHGAVMTLTARENLTLADLGPVTRRQRISRTAESTEARAWFERLDVLPRGAEERPLSTFSGGNQQKILLAKWLRCDPQVLLLDEPTQGVDIPSKLAIHRSLLAAANGGTAIVVCSSDVDELVALCHSVHVIRDGRVVAEITGDGLNAAAVGSATLGTDALAS
jgi:ribose transport system ATP-binding protein